MPAQQLTGFPTLYGAQASTTSTAAVFQPGDVFVHKNGAEWALVKYIQLDNNGCSQGEALVTNYATLKSYSVKIADSASADIYGGSFRGIAMATIASQSFGFMAIAGYVEKADISRTTASQDFLYLSGSTDGKLTNISASPHVIAVARTAIATGVGSISILGTWG